MSYIVGTNNELGNTLGPWTEMGRADNEDEGRGMARDLALVHGIHADSGYYVMVWKEGTSPRWACTIEEPELFGAWGPTLSLNSEATGG